MWKGFQRSCRVFSVTGSKNRCMNPWSFAGMGALFLAWHFFNYDNGNWPFSARTGGGTGDILEEEPHHSMRSSHTAAINQCKGNLSKFAGPSWPIVGYTRAAGNSLCQPSQTRTHIMVEEVDPPGIETLLQNVGILSALPLNGACRIWLWVAMSTLFGFHSGLKVETSLRSHIKHVPFNGCALKNPAFCSSENRPTKSPLKYL